MSHASDSVGWITLCPFDHRARNDPIVYPRKPGASHLHDFMGNRSTNAYSTYKSLLRAGTSCKLKADRAAYWAPALKVHGVFVKPIEASFYYRSITYPHSAVRAFPGGLKVIAGDSHATHPQSTSRVYWSCDSGSALSRPPSCRTDQHLTAHVNFPDCWDGVHRDSADHKRHMAYSHENSAGRHVCPAGHPVPVPRLIVRLEWNVHDGTKISLSSGPFYTLHADFINSWNQDALRTLVRKCINANKDCGKPTSIP